jgi:CBS domain-containing protein
VLGAFFELVAVGLSMPDQIDGVAAWLGYINLLLLVFNLLPALPLDGGRVLRSVLWELRGDFAWATRIASAIGRGFGYLFIAGGVAMFFWMDQVGGLWLAFIGWFLLGAATAEARYLAVRDALEGVRVRDLMVRDPVTVTPDLTLTDLYDRVIWSHRYTTYPVVEDGRVVGLLPFRCVAQVPRSEWPGKRVRDCMLPLDTVPQLRADDPAAEALAELNDGVGRGIVLEDGNRLAGLLSITDVVRALEVGALRRRQLEGGR